MNQSLRKSLGAVVLALATLAAVIFAILNFDQRNRYETPDDGVTWWDSAQGVEAWHVAPDAPAARAGVKAGDHLVAVNGAEVHSATQVTRRLWRAGLWAQVRYRLNRHGLEFETSLVTAPAAKPTSIENPLRVVGLLYLFIGLFIFIRRWNAPRAIHFYVFCLVSFILYSFHYSGKLDAFDWIVYWSNIVATLLAPALLLHFALVFPERAESRLHSTGKVAAVYALPATLLTVHLLVATSALGFLAWPGSRLVLAQLELGFLGACFLAAGFIFYFNYRRAPSGVLRQQLKWLTRGTLAGTAPYLLFNILPFLAGINLRAWMNYSALTLVLIPL
ncbi:MAG TPA: PDZ domain-containing protein, partial [Candidatus Limnocylindria bacterium]|nr:PDZ domain-containing protein [Candidatus Limnocylindria bacterium]